MMLYARGSAIPHVSRAPRDLAHGTRDVFRSLSNRCRSRKDRPVIEHHAEAVWPSAAARRGRAEPPPSDGDFSANEERPIIAPAVRQAQGEAWTSAVLACDTLFVRAAAWRVRRRGRDVPTTRAICPQAAHGPGGGERPASACPLCGPASRRHCLRQSPAEAWPTSLTGRGGRGWRRCLRPTRGRDVTPFHGPRPALQPALIRAPVQTPEVLIDSRMSKVCSLTAPLTR